MLNSGWEACLEARGMIAGLIILYMEQLGEILIQL